VFFAGLMIVYPGSAGLAQKPGTFGYTEMPWVVTDPASSLERVSIGIRQPVYLAALTPEQPYVLQRNLTVRKGHVIPAGTSFAKAKGAPLTLCETQRRREANYVECFTDADSAGTFTASYPVSLSYASAMGVWRLTNFIGKRYYDSKAPLAQPAALSDFGPASTYDDPIRVYLSLVKVNADRSSAQLEFCTASKKVAGASCANRFTLDGSRLPLRFSTPHGAGELHDIQPGAVTLSFVPGLSLAGS
jgi:hypothetical protein